MAPGQRSDLTLEHIHLFARQNASFDGHWRDGATPEGFILESWSEGFMVGALMIMACITVANMRQGVILHKLILCEVCRHHALDLVVHQRLIVLASPGHISRHVLLHEFPRLWVVSFQHGRVTVLLVGDA